MHNYSYDKIGNLVADKSEEIEEISWTMQGKVKEIRRTTGSQKPDLVFNYDGLGNRVSKTVIPKSSVNNEDSITTYYIRDAQGNILATYEKTKYKNGDEKFYLKEQYLYGSSRIGMKVSNQLLASKVDGSVEIKEYDGYFTKTVGNKRYELTNHLGNVLAVVSDKKLPDNEPDVVSVSDYYPFGMQMPGRSFSPAEYRFGYTGHEKENDIAEGMYGTETRLLDTRLGIWRGVDELFTMYPSWSSYSYVVNNPMKYIDFDGREIKFVIRQVDNNVVLTYKNGNFWHSNGQRYNPGKENLSKTLYRTLAAYRKILDSKDKVLIHQLNTLENSEHTHWVETSPYGKNSVSPYSTNTVEVKKAINEEKGVGTQTQFDFSEQSKENFKESTGVEKSDFTTVVHEMQHQYDYDNGNMKDSQDVSGAKDPAEKRAVNNENRARKIEKLPKRTTYGGEEIKGLN